MPMTKAEHDTFRTSHAHPVFGRLMVLLEMVRRFANDAHDTHKAHSCEYRHCQLCYTTFAAGSNAAMAFGALTGEVFDFPYECATEALCDVLLAAIARGLPRLKLTETERHWIDKLHFDKPDWMPPELADDDASAAEVDDPADEQLVVEGR